MILEQAKPEHEQIVKIHGVRGFLSGAVTLVEVRDLRVELGEVPVLFTQDCVDGLMGVQGKGKDLGQHLGLGKACRFCVNVRFSNTGGD